MAVQLTPKEPRNPSLYQFQESFSAVNWWYRWAFTPNYGGRGCWCPGLIADADFAADMAGAVEYAGGLGIRSIDVV